MLPEIPMYVSILFGLTTIVGIYLFYLATDSKKFLLIVSIWSVLIGAIGFSGFFAVTDPTSFPPRLFLAVAPTLIAMAVLFNTKKGKAFIDGINMKRLTYAHTIRIPVEIVLSLLFHAGTISILQTMEGTNFDILSGLTAPIVAYLFFTRKSLSQRALLIWNIVCFLLVLNVVVTSTLAIESAAQMVGFDQPNEGILYFPFVLLPAVLVPLVFFGHFVAIRRCLKGTV